MGLAAIGEAKLDQVKRHVVAFDAEVLVLHVLSPRAIADGTVSAAEAGARSFLDTIVAGLRTAGIRAEPLIQTGPVAEVIVDEADRQNVQLIILGANVRNGISNRILGSIAERVTRNAPCPVLIVPTPRATHRHRALWSFREASERAGAMTRRRLGVRAVPVARIVGSVGRWDELEADFRPRRRLRRSGDEDRFAGVLRALERGHAMPAVQLYKLGFGYYVLDGHHRVAAALSLGQEHVDAEVTEFTSPTARAARPTSGHTAPVHCDRGARSARSPVLRSAWRDLEVGVPHPPEALNELHQAELEAVFAGQ
jgi:nucleotide-binding universal stress UspA family protein